MAAGFAYFDFKCGMKGFISQNRKRRHQERRSAMPKKIENTTKNPWGNLAQDWSSVTSKPKNDQQDVDDPGMLAKIVDVRTILRSNRSNPPAPPPTIHSSDSELNRSESSSEEEEMSWTKKLKGPQMRMHADEEEKKINKKRKMAAARLTITKPHRTQTKIVETPRVEDLRSRISQVNQGSVWSRLQRPPSAKERRRGFSSEDIESEEEEEPVRHKVQSTIAAIKGDLRGAISVKKTGGHDRQDLRSKIVKPEPQRSSRSRRRSPTPPKYRKEDIRIEIKNDTFKGQKSKDDENSSASGSESDSSSSGSSSSSSSSSGSSSSSSSDSSDDDNKKKPKVKK